MNFIKIIEVNSKKLVGTSLLLSLMAVQSVGAADSVSDEMVSAGNIEYDVDADGAADILFYSKDLTTIATGIDSLNTNVATLQQSFETLGNTTAEYKTNIITGLNSNVYAKANIPTDATFEQIIEKINNIPAPTTATGNVWSSGDNSGIGITANGQSVNIDGVTSLNLAANESVTLPSGYYPNDITISNNVANRDSTPIILTSSNNTHTFEEGYYGSFTVSTNINSLPGRIEYTIVHRHYGTPNGTSPSGCYTQAYQSYECIDPGHGEYWASGDVHVHAKDPEYGYVTRYRLGCGHEEGDFLRTSTSNECGSNEKIGAATIIYD